MEDLKKWNNELDKKVEVKQETSGQENEEEVSNFFDSGEETEEPSDEDESDEGK